MNAACPTCGQIALPPARYCRACYTIFPTPRFAVPRQQADSGSRAWQLLALLALAIGGWWAYNSDSAAPEAERGWADAAPRDDDASGGFDSTARNDNGGHGRTAASGGPERAARARTASTGEWLLQLAPARVCGGAGACEVTIGFASGERARFSVRAQSDSSSALVPLGADGGALLARHARATVVPEDEHRAISIVRPGGRRWIAVGGA